MIQKFQSIWFLSLLFVLLIPFASIGSEEISSVNKALQSANEAYSSGRYEAAIDQYSSIIEENGLSGEILYNLGNSYAQKGQYGMAILQYLRGLRLSPGDSDIHGNLELVRKEAGLFEEQPSFNERIWNHFDMNQWACISLAALVVFSLLLAICFRFPGKRGIRVSCIIVMLVFVFACFGVFWQYRLWDANVIIESQTRLSISPFETASSLGMIKEGSLVFTEKKHGEYFYVHDNTGRSGWVHKNAFEPVTISQTTFRQEGVVQ